MQNEGMPRRIHLEPHLSNDELQKRYRAAADPVELIRSTTLFHWWPKRLKKRQGPRRN